MSLRERKRASMAALSASLLLLLPHPFSSTKRCRSYFPSHSRNPNYRPISSIVACENRALCSMPILSQSQEILTLREICQGHVPEPVLKRQGHGHFAVLNTFIFSYPNDQTLMAYQRLQGRGSWICNTN